MHPAHACCLVLCTHSLSAMLGSLCAVVSVLIQSPEETHCFCCRPPRSLLSLPALSSHAPSPSRACPRVAAVVITSDTFCVGLARVGTDTQFIAAGPASVLRELDFGPPLHCLVIPAPGALSEMERAVLATFSPRNFDDPDDVATAPPTAVASPAHPAVTEASH